MKESRIKVVSNMDTWQTDILLQELEQHLRMSGIDALVYTDGKISFCLGKGSLSRKVSYFERITCQQWDDDKYGAIEQTSHLIEIVSTEKENTFFLPAGFTDEEDDGADIIETIAFALGEYGRDHKTWCQDVELGRIYSLNSGKLLRQFSIHNNKIRLL